jgi:putative DNA primase/helicase
LQEFSGYIFTKLNLEKLLLCTGTGANGKSVYFNIISGLVGKDNILNNSMGSFASEYHRAKLTNVLLNYSSEKGTDLDPDIFKALVSGEPVSARLPYGSPFTLRNKVRFIINANQLPKNTEQTKAYFRRFLVIPFEVTISEKDRNIHLADEIIEKELPGVFNWLLQGLDRIMSQGDFTECEKATNALEEFKKQSDSAALFVESNCYAPSTVFKEPLAVLYREYSSFCNDDGYKPVGKNNFSIRMENAGFKKTRGSTGDIMYFIEKEIPKG